MLFHGKYEITHQLSEVNGRTGQDYQPAGIIDGLVGNEVACQATLAVRMSGSCTTAAMRTSLE
jgi:hypothetical protein